MTFLSEHADAARIAAEAGNLLLDLRRRLDADGVDLKALRDDGDRRSNELILRRLREAYPNDLILSEESKDDPSRLASRRVWIVDPLDGTPQFGEVGRPAWRVPLPSPLDGAPLFGR